MNTNRIKENTQKKLLKYFKYAIKPIQKGIFVVIIRKYIRKVVSNIFPYNEIRTYVQSCDTLLFVGCVIFELEHPYYSAPNTLKVSHF
jgi:hypothetical protein